MKRSPRLALPLLAAGIGACAPDAAVLPPDPPPPVLAPDQVRASVYASAADLAIAVEDADLRVIPTLGDAPEAAAVDAAFAALGAAVTAEDAEAARTAARSAREALAALEAAGGDPVEIAGLGLVLEGADALYPAAPGASEITP